jgi:heme exporter protein C
MFATMHPRPIIGKPDRPSLPNEMLLTFLIAMVSFSLLYVAFVRSRYRFAVERDAAAARAEHNA